MSSSRSRPAITRSIFGYTRSWLGSDVVRGDRWLGGADPFGTIVRGDRWRRAIVGLYTVPLVLVAYEILGGSKLLAAGPDAASSALASSGFGVSETALPIGCRA